jgi:hypothetical protein
MTIPDDHPLRTGIEALRHWLDDHRTNANRFAIQNGIDPSVLGKLLRGTTRRMSVDLANKVERATSRGVPYEVWLPPGEDSKALVNVLKEPEP